MKKKLHIILAVLVLSGLTTTAQIKRGSEKKTPPKTEQTQKKQKQTPSSSNNEKSKKTSKTITQQSSTPYEAEPSSTQTNVVPVQPAEPTAYDVKFSCNVSEATIYIDGDDYGKPNGTRTLKTGSHQVKLVADGYEDYSATINIASGSTSFDFMMTGAIPRETYVAKVETFTVKGVSFEMVYVEGGAFLMGTNEVYPDDYSENKPAHQVMLSDYYIGKYEVTQELWQAVMGNNPSEFKNNSQKPVENVSWNDCQKFIKKLNKLTGRNFRLPTEAEWEFAARGGNRSNGYIFAGSNDIDEVAWNGFNSGYMTHPVGQKSPNELGIYDMSGNVEEWCQDWNGNYSSESQTNPTGPSSGSSRVTRGGWYEAVSYCKVFSRIGDYPSNSFNWNGLRLAL